MTPDLRALVGRLWELEAKATKGPWECQYDEDEPGHVVSMRSALEGTGVWEPIHRIEYNHGISHDEERRGAQRQFTEAEANAALIAEMRNALPAILDALDTAVVECSTLRRSLRWLASEYEQDDVGDHYWRSSVGLSPSGWDKYIRPHLEEPRDG